MKKELDISISISINNLLKNKYNKYTENITRDFIKSSISIVIDMANTKIKNKDIFQIIITIIFITFVFFVEFKIGSIFINKTQKNENLNQEELVQIFSGFYDKLKNIYNYFMDFSYIYNYIHSFNI